MFAVVTTLLLSIFAPLFAWTGSTSLIKQRSKSWGILRASARFIFWAFALIVVRDHLIRITHSNTQSSGLLESVFATLGLVMLMACIINVERISFSALGLKKRLRNTEFLAGMGIGFATAIVLIETNILQRICLVPSISIPCRAGLSLAIGASQSLVFQALVPALTKKRLATSVALILAAVMCTFSWVSISLFGPLPVFNTLAFAGWSSLVATLAFMRYGFVGAVGASSALLFLLSRP